MLEELYYRLHRRAARSDERGKYSAGYWQDAVRSLVLEWCRMREGNLLEVGCGEGLFLSRLAHRTKKLSLWGIDNDPGRLDLIRQYFRDLGIEPVPALKLADAGSSGLEDDFFDTVVCVNVCLNLSSFAAFEEVLCEMRRVCRPGGRIIFDFRNGRNALLKLKYKLAPWYDKTVKNLSLRAEDPVRVEAALKRLGLWVCRKAYLGFGKRLWAPIVIVEVRK